MPDPERRRLAEDTARSANWKRWGPYLAERQWGTVREDYSADGSCWTYFPHDHARSRAYRWGEDGLLGMTDRQGRLCFAWALWNGRDPFLKERLYGLGGPEGNHGEDVKESYFYLDGTPTHSYGKALYKYPQEEFPYARLAAESGRRGLDDPEFELADTGIFDEDRYFDVQAEYAKAAPDDVLIRLTITNRGPERAELHVLPTLWFRNTWSWGRTGEGYDPKPSIERRDDDVSVVSEHATLGRFVLSVEPSGADSTLLFCDNETNAERLFEAETSPRFPKDAFHDSVVSGRADAADRVGPGTKAAFHIAVTLEPGRSTTVRARLSAEAEHPVRPFDPDEFEDVFAARIAEADAFYENVLPTDLERAERSVSRQAYAGLLWTKQFYYFDIAAWLEGDPAQPAAPAARRDGRNQDWTHLYNRDVISMPDGWEYPWYAAWDLAFHMIPFARIDPAFAKQQLLLFLREWYMSPSGQIPAYEFAFGDVNPPVHAWACWRVYKITGERGHRDRDFLERAFQKLLLNFTWWVNRKDPDGKHLFSGGFLGLDNIGVFDRSKPLPGSNSRLEQADGTAWMAFYCATMLSMALELARENAAYEDLASKFFEHFVAITDAMNTLGDRGLWDERDGFYYDQLRIDHDVKRMRVRSMVGLIPLFAVEILEQDLIERLPGFAKRMRWFLDNRPHLARHVIRADHIVGDEHAHTMLAIVSRERLERVLRYVLDETEFLSPHGVRSLSKAHEHSPFSFELEGRRHEVRYAPAESDTSLFGGNSNWRGPVWFPLNYLLLEALERYHHFYGDDLRVECPVGSGRMRTLQEVAFELGSRLTRLFLPDATGRRPCHGDDGRFARDPHWRELALFHEYFDGETGRGLGASHQTGWTALVARCIEDLSHMRHQDGCGPDGLCVVPKPGTSHS